MIRIFGKKIFKSKDGDRSKEYWERSANKDLPSVMNDICDGWDKETFDKLPTQFIELVLKNVSLQDNVLDLACGIGRNCKWVSPKVAWYHGIDFIEKMIVMARLYNQEITNQIFHVNNGKTIPYNENYFDLIFSELAFQHMNKPIQESYFDEVKRTLKVGGIFMAQIPTMKFYENDSYARTKEELDAILPDVEYLDGHPAYYTIRWVKRNQK